MTSDVQRAGASAGLSPWCTGDEGDQAIGISHTSPCQDSAEQPVAEHPVGSVNAEQPLYRKDYVDDANAFAVSFCRDFRALQLNRDHDCTTTCVKYVKKGTQGGSRRSHSSRQQCRMPVLLLSHCGMCLQRCTTCRTAWAGGSQMHQEEREETNRISTQCQHKRPKRAR